MNLHEQAINVQSRDDFVKFVQALLRDLRSGDTPWENATLDRFIEALAAWSNDMDGYYANRGEAAPAQPSWRLLAEILLAATMYE